MKPDAKKCVLESTVAETNLLIFMWSYRDAFGVPPTPFDPDFLTIKEVMKRTGLSRSTVDRMVKRGREEAAKRADADAA